MLNFFAEIDIMPHSQILDPQGKAISSSMKSLDLPEIKNIRVGKHLTLEVSAESKEEAEKKVDLACKKLLVNLIMEQYTFSLKESNS